MHTFPGTICRPSTSTATACSRRRMRRAGHAADQTTRRATVRSINMAGITPELLVVTVVVHHLEEAGGALEVDDAPGERAVAVELLVHDSPDEREALEVVDVLHDLLERALGLARWCGLLLGRHGRRVRLVAARFDGLRSSAARRHAIRTTVAATSMR